jgi:hypothetical protein
MFSRLTDHSSSTNMELGRYLFKVMAEKMSHGPYGQMLYTEPASLPTIFLGKMRMCTCSGSVNGGHLRHVTCLMPAFYGRYYLPVV